MKKAKPAEEPKRKTRGVGKPRLEREDSILGRIGYHVERLRKLSGFTSQELADLAGVGLSTVIKIEGGRTKPSFLNVLAIALALGVSIERLMYPLPKE